MNKVYKTDMGRLVNGDCRAQSENIESGTVDLILSDPPYGTVKGLEIDGWEEVDTDWDETINPNQFFKIADRILRVRGKMVLFGQEPWTSELITSATSNVAFSYRMVWKKEMFGNPLGCKSAPVGEFEDISVFTKQHDSNGGHPLRGYAKKIQEFIGLPSSEIEDIIGHGGADHFFRTDSPQFALCTYETYTDLIAEFDIDKMSGFLQYGSLKAKDEQFKNNTPNTFNLPPGQKYRSDVLEYNKPQKPHHPTQKPVALLEDLIRTFTNKGDTVADLTAGSGSTAVAAQNTDRRFIAIEKDREYFETAVGRVSGGSTASPSGQQDLSAFATD